MKQMANCQVEKLTPFGVCIRPQKKISLKELSRDELLQLAQKNGFILFREFDCLEKEDLLKFCANDPQKELLHWDFGPVMEMKVDSSPQNYLFSTEKVPFHWDGAFHTVPSFLVFNCIQPPDPDCGGETLFCNTKLIWERASKEKKEFWQKIELVFATEKKAHYGGRIQNPLVQQHPHTKETILRYAEPVKTKLNPVSLEVLGLEKSKHQEFIEEMQQFIYDAKLCFSHQWQQGDLLIADNHSLIHGRNGFTKNCPRHLRRIQIL